MASAPSSVTVLVVLARGSSDSIAADRIVSAAETLSAFGGEWWSVDCPRPLSKPKSIGCVLVLCPELDGGETEDATLSSIIGDTFRDGECEMSASSEDG